MLASLTLQRQDAFVCLQPDPCWFEPASVSAPFHQEWSRVEVVGALLTWMLQSKDTDLRIAPSSWTLEVLEEGPRPAAIIA